MAKKVWTIELQENAHSNESRADFSSRRRTRNVQLDHNYWTAKRVIRVDGQQVPEAELESYGRFGHGSDDLFWLDGHRCHVQIRSNGFVYLYDFAVDGYSVVTGGPVVPWEETEGRALRKMPGWGWLFIILCMAVSLSAHASSYWLYNVVPKSSGVTVGIAMTGIYAITSASKDLSREAKSRMLKCAGVVTFSGVAVLIADAILFMPK